MACRSSAPSSRPRTSPAAPTPATGARSTAAFLTGSTSPTPRRRRSSCSKGGHRRPHGQVPAAGLADQPPALLGLPDPGRLLPDSTASSRCPTTSSRCCCPTMSSSCPTGESPLKLPRGVLGDDLSDLRGPGDDARPTRWTPLSTPRGTSCASAIPHDEDVPGRRRRPPGISCRSTSTSAASPTRSCTCSTRAFSPGRSATPVSRQGDPRAVRAALLPGDDPPRRPRDVEVEGQRRLARRVLRERRRRRACASCTSSSARRSTTSTGTSRPTRSSTAVPLPGPGLAPRHRPVVTVRDGRRRARGRTDELRRAVHRTIARVTTDIDRYAFNTACRRLHGALQHGLSPRPEGTDRVLSRSRSTPSWSCLPLLPPPRRRGLRAPSHDNVHTRPWPVADLRTAHRQDGDDGGEPTAR